MADIQSKVQEELVRTKKDLIKKAKAVKLDKDNRTRTYIHARRLWNEFGKYQKAGKYDLAFYCLHLYLRVVLENKLHRKEGFDENFHKVANETLENLKILEIELERCYNGIRQQLWKKHLQQQHNEAISPKRPAPAAPTARKPAQSQEEPATFSSIKRENSLYPDLNNPTPAPSHPHGRDRSESAGGRFLRSSFDATKNRPTNFRQHRVDGDGHCAFRAIAQGQGNGNLPSVIEEQKALELRKRVAKELISLRDEEMMETGLTVEQVVTMDPSGKHSNFTSYVRGMAGSDYAGEMELWIISKALNLGISVFKNGSTGYEHMVTYGEGKNNTKDVSLLWQPGQMGDGGNHYDALIPA
uniref:Ubiquitin thioesterase OTU n=1 Tax=Aplanochytrium stocchinoi TaxID=215587 RepID=A0A7S3LRB8_9STRA|mmetsp:Transcript_10326/g.12885  ORF Transcript_10326/g.12885 Transcript_10326/m.12885 type:complete len:356 (-) Transcript_10326:831-1898(-)|eukprot:CAMPEP_0204825262 /NCGR_PEP_ID=MMETSP1346-20131115/3183_1 /ASSEMBLY_ACC=CAM_ASM_000771 /TAXON_ID=215587 /ORGANISM="Aplanochytrium stocchinoi, Strain GSBS06" /LENGTH=355 /DNA_ID=CAMNT_0051952833 /DNA_START=220 /DNA_END=1287 /DNA_ORIENTATION=-